MSLWNHRLDQNTNKNFDSFCPGPFRAEIIKIFVGILVQTKTSKRHFEINWPLHTDLKWQIWRNNCFNGKTCKFDSDISDFNSVDLKKTKKIIKGQIFFQRPNLKAKGQKFQILWFFQWFGLVCKQLFRKSHWFK